MIAISDEEGIIADTDGRIEETVDQDVIHLPFYFLPLFIEFGFADCTVLMPSSDTKLSTFFFNRMGLRR